MCGIGGLQLKEQSTLDLSACLQTILKVQDHRGRDSQDRYINKTKTTGLSHNRLSILDLSSSGNQPMHSACGRYILSFNGEIYNWRELRTDLEAHGHTFRSNCDSEVLLELYAAKGEAFLPVLRGMFAFAIYDQETNEIFCARDRVGKKTFGLFRVSLGSRLCF